MYGRWGGGEGRGRGEEQSGEGGQTGCPGQSMHFNWIIWTHQQASLVLTVNMCEALRRRKKTLSVGQGGGRILLAKLMSLCG